MVGAAYLERRNKQNKKKRAARCKESRILAEVETWSFAFRVSTGGHRNARRVHWRRGEADIRGVGGGGGVCGDLALRLSASLSVSLRVSPLSSSSSSSERCSESNGRATSERRERASIHDQSRVRNTLQPVFGDV